MLYGCSVDALFQTQDSASDISSTHLKHDNILAFRQH
jgi:hypothetical protein